MRAWATPEQIAALAALVPALPADTYLAGGVAIAATLHHRISRDLDFFVPAEFDPEQMAERLVNQVEGLTVTSTAPGTLYVEVHGVPASVIMYRYPLLSAPEPNTELSVRVASLEDLACMKLSAVASRGMARDFWDLHALLAHGVAAGSLDGALRLYQRKFTADDIGHVVRSLVYFGDADIAPLPLGLPPADWQRIKRDFERWVSKLE
ncbi:MAG: nucleotidyl transferase AbiEii/AbiGii toxin family protein [Myxococcales bacterium]|nr:nucleotidyl transferase AbiEii/AbiGii toxin family protein [Myxococcales bacterium]